ncbi:MAG: hypothetical protein GXO87_04125 [Chlorobi bacterium]|nr:hypothetical protein [Chlorobiota bacterium]
MNATKIKNILFKNNLNIIIGGVTLLIIFLLFFAAVYIFNVAKEDAKRIHQAQQLELAKSAAHGIDTYFNRLEQDLVYTTLYSESQKELKNYLAHQINKEVVKSVFLVDGNGRIILEEGKLLNDASKRIVGKLFSENKQSGKFHFLYSEVLPYFENSGSDSLYFFILHLFANDSNSIDRNAKGSGFLISFDWLMEQFIVPLKLSESDFAWVLDNSGKLIYHPTHSDMLLRNISDTDESCAECHSTFSVQKQMLAGKASTAEYSIGDEPNKIVGYYPIILGQKKWILAISTYLPAITADINKNFKAFFIASGTAILLILILAAVFFITNLNKIKATQAAKHLLETSRIQEKLNHASKLASLGELVDSVAHEINTPTGIISAEADSMLFDDKINQSVKNELRIIKKQTRRIADYTKSLLTYSRRMPFNPKVNDLIKLIDECLFLLNPKLRSKQIQIEKDFEREKIEFLFDWGKVEQVIINIISNAVDFIGENPKITIKVTFENETEEKNIKKYTVIRISDNGSGVAEQNRELIFDPFFSTKEPGKGTGLGLSISKAIVKRHGGKISVESNNESGATFVIKLPYIQTSQY